VGRFLRRRCAVDVKFRGIVAVNARPKIGGCTKLTAGMPYFQQRNLICYVLKWFLRSSGLDSFLKDMQETISSSSSMV
jgi:hypothetical protein